ncbi:FAS-associated factor 1-like isoform X2 [Drosophila kikkawai]|uniref:FAS-associated factor 1-like isoform X2 n=1 Tax=Drosophila kikkawai TaxID=30033 RepID=A0A6P4JL19_DROKI
MTWENLNPKGTDLAVPRSEEPTSFVQNYRKQYGEPSLKFFKGNLKSAYEAACNQPDDEKKVLALYLHHSGSVLTNTLCHQVLKNDEVLTTFNNLFIVYGWDMSNATDANFFHEQLRNIISVEAADAAKNLKVEQMPAFLIIGQGTDGRIPNIAIVHGDYDDDTLQTRLQLEYSLLSGLLGFHMIRHPCRTGRWR